MVTPLLPVLISIVKIFSRYLAIVNRQARSVPRCSRERSAPAGIVAMPLALAAIYCGGLAQADIKNWQTGETIPGTEDIIPGLTAWLSDARFPGWHPSSGWAGAIRACWSTDF